jgi:hypothetical protein
VVARLFRRWGRCTIDRFASPDNAVCRRFNRAYLGGLDDPWSARPTSETNSLNAMAHDWGGREFNWLCPPWHLLANVVRTLEADQATAILLVPTWPSADWWPHISSMTRDRIELGKASDVFHVGPSGLFEPGRNSRWTVTALYVYPTTDPTAGVRSSTT